MSEPTTEAGRRLLAALNDDDVIMGPEMVILAIEAEARASQPLTLDVERLRVLRDVLNQWLYSDGSDPGAEESLVIAAREWIEGDAT